MSSISGSSSAHKIAGDDVEAMLAHLDDEMTTPGRRLQNTARDLGVLEQRRHDPMAFDRGVTVLGEPIVGRRQDEALARSDGVHRTVSAAP